MFFAALEAVGEVYDESTQTRPDTEKQRQDP